MNRFGAGSFLVFSLVFFLFIGCVEKKKSAMPETKVEPISEQPMVLAKEPAPGPCDKALQKVPIYQKAKKGVFLDVFDFYKNYSQCMDAGIATGISFVVTKALSEQWKTSLTDLQLLIQKDPKFENFVLLSINSSVTDLTKEVQQIERHGRENCPSVKLKSLCVQLNTEAKRALKAEKEEYE